MNKTHLGGRPPVTPRNMVVPEGLRGLLERDDSSDNCSDHGSDSCGSDSAFDFASSCSDNEEEDSCCNEVWVPPLEDPDIHARVIQLSSYKCCEKTCLSRDKAAVEKLVRSLREMSKDARRSSVLNALAISAAVVGTKRQYGKGQRDRYVYLIPFCGEVCKAAFQAIYDLTNNTLRLARSQVKRGVISLEAHKNERNKNAQKLDHDRVAMWIQHFAQCVGDHSAVRFRRQETVDGTTVRHQVRESITFLPAHFTWERVHKEYELFLSSSPRTQDVRFPSLSAFMGIVNDRCKNIRVRSPQSNVCDICAIYRNNMSRAPTTPETEIAGMHAVDARAIRELYAKDIGSANSVHEICTIDYAQNVALPHSARTPSAWYFLSLISVSVFGVFSENTKLQSNYVYSERVAAKGSNEVVSLLHRYATSNGVYTDNSGDKTWTIYADNCGGQNKNNHVIRYLLFLVDSGRLKSANLYFFVKGHTRNNCDRGFGNIKKAYVKSDLYTTQQVTDMITKSSSTNTGICLEDEVGVFKDWKKVLDPVYKDLAGIQKYQLFSFNRESPGKVFCRKRPSSTPLVQDLTRVKSRGEDFFKNLWSSFPVLQPPTPNPEKISDLHKKILPYIPPEYQSHALYRAPTEGEAAEAAEKKRRRTKSTPTLAQRKTDRETKSQN